MSGTIRKSDRWAGEKITEIKLAEDKRNEKSRA